MIKSGTSKERVAEILKASGVRGGDQLVYFSNDGYALNCGHYDGFWLAQSDVMQGFTVDRDFFYAIRIEKDYPRKIELVEPKTLDEKLFDVLWQCVTYGMHELKMRQASAECAKVAEEHFKK